MKKFETAESVIHFLRANPPTRVKPLLLDKNEGSSRSDREELSLIWQAGLVALKRSIKRSEKLNQGKLKTRAFAAYYLQPDDHISICDITKKLHLTERDFYRFITEVRDLFEAELIKLELMEAVEDERGKADKV